LGWKIVRKDDGINELFKIIFNRLNENVNRHGKKATRVLVVLLKAVTHLTHTYPGFVGEDGLEDKLLLKTFSRINFINDSKRKAH
jgi:hypothetical protein